MSIISIRQPKNLLLAALSITVTTVALRSVPFSVLYSDQVDLFRWVLLCGAIFALVLILQNWETMSDSSRAIAIGIILVPLPLFAWDYFQIAVSNIRQPPEWDFQLFWVFGKVIASRLNPYNQANLIHAAQILDPSEAFLNELYFFHPPPAIFLYWPLGWFDIHTSYTLWYGITALAFIASSILIWRLFLVESEWIGLPVAGFLLLGMRPSMSTVVHGQTNFLVLLSLLIYWMSRRHSQAGIALAVGIIVKPVLAIMPIFSMMQKRFRELGVIVFTIFLLFLISAIPLGIETVTLYLSKNPILSDMPQSLYYEPVNQSLFATVLRLTNPAASSRLSPIAFSWAFALTGLLTLVTIGIIMRSSRTKQEIVFGFVIAFATLVFPKTLVHYPVLLIIPWMIIYTMRQSVPGKLFGTAAIIALLYGVINLGGSFTFLAMILTWGVMGYIVATSKT